MTGRTHDLAAFTALNIVFVTHPPPQMTIATVIAALGANMIGGLLPDIDNATADIWDKVRGGRVIGHLIQPLIGSHRMISHSIFGLAIIGYLLKNIILPVIGTVILVDMNIIFDALMIGYISHLVVDSFTTQGIPLFFPIPVRIGFPPNKHLRIKTGGLLEKILIFPGLLFINGYLIYTNYQFYEIFLRSYLK
ncbi:metal-dependent hydrolase [Candidatus Gottesmanbacteria bacterium]|nr:metal-dependent hydrolase [Candidatus Gottesmanbacteria bacterium]